MLFENELYKTEINSSIKAHFYERIGTCVEVLKIMSLAYNGEAKGWTEKLPIPLFLL